MISFFELREKLKKGADIGDYIKDFRKSKAPQFKGKPDEKIQKMAIAAYYANQENYKYDYGSPESIELMKKITPGQGSVKVMSGKARNSRKKLFKTTSNEDQFIKLHKKIKKDLCKNNIYIDEVVFCPHHPTKGIGKYRKYCKCRKPNNLLVKNIFKKWPINRKKSVFIGDNYSDKKCAEKSNLKFYFDEKDLFFLIKKKIKL